ncbi:MAG: DUF1854 domain-containing protein, partial [Pirellula sp.]
FLERGPAIDWLKPECTEFRRGNNDVFEMWVHGERIASSIFITAALPASQPESYLSIREWRDHGEDVEVGMIAHLSEWSETNQTLIRQLLRRRYLLRSIEKVNQVKLRLGFLEFDVHTNLGNEKFLMRWTQSQAIDFGERGKMLMDTEENRFIVPDIDQLPSADRERFLQYVYW